MMLRESATRQVLIHPLLLAAGWKLDDRTQVRFEGLVARHERLRSVQRESLRQSDHLFQTLLHQAFATGL